MRKGLPGGCINPKVIGQERPKGRHAAFYLKNEGITDGPLNQKGLPSEKMH